MKPIMLTLRSASRTVTMNVAVRGGVFRTSEDGRAAAPRYVLAVGPERSPAPLKPRPVALASLTETEALLGDAPSPWDPDPDHEGAEKAA